MKFPYQGVTQVSVATFNHPDFAHVYFKDSAYSFKADFLINVGKDISVKSYPYQSGY